MDRKVISKLLGISEKSFYRWKEERLIFKLLVITSLSVKSLAFLIGVFEANKSYPSPIIVNGTYDFDGFVTSLIKFKRTGLLINL